MKNNKKFIPLILAAFAVLIMAGCTAGDRADDASGATTTSTTAPKPKVTEGSFAELRKTCTTDDRKIFNAIVRQFNEYPKVTDTPATAPFSDELRFILASPENEWYAIAVAFGPEDSCLKAFVPYLPLSQPTSGGHRGGGNGGGGGNNSNGGGIPTQSTVGGSDCSGGNIDPDGTGPRGCEPTVVSNVGAGGGIPTQPVPPPATTTSTTVATNPAAPEPIGPPATATPGECWVIDGIPQGNCN